MNVGVYQVQERVFGAPGAGVADGCKPYVVGLGTELGSFTIAINALITESFFYPPESLSLVLLSGRHSGQYILLKDSTVARGQTWTLVQTWKPL